MTKLGKFAAACGAVLCAFGAMADVDITFDPAVADYAPVIREAVESTDPGGVITLSEGVYPLASALAVDRAITLRGAENGGTILMGAYVRNSDANNVSQLTVSGGATLDHLAITGGKSKGMWGRLARA